MWLYTKSEETIAHRRLPIKGNELLGIWLLTEQQNSCCVCLVTNNFCDKHHGDHKGPESSSLRPGTMAKWFDVTPSNQCPSFVEGEFMASHILNVFSLNVSFP